MSDREQVDGGALGAQGDPFATSAGSYVLGGLSPVERAAFEMHLRTCRACEQEVAEVAGLPGLLARVPLDLVESLDDPTAPPPDLLPHLLRQVRTRRRRLQGLAAGAVALAAACAIGLAIVVGTGVGAPGGTAPVAAAPIPLVAMTAVVPELEITAKVGLTGVAWGTKVQMTCFYGLGKGDQPWPYVLVAIDRAGQTQQVASWTAIPGREARVSGSSSWQRSDIRELEVRTSTGVPIMRLAV